jgi:hypothetical protein
LLAAGCLLVLAAVALVALYSAARYEPAFYRKAMETDRAALEKGSDRMLQKAAALQSSLAKVGHWEFLFTADEINGWLAVDLARNHPHTLPPTLRDPRVAITPNEITVACRFEQSGLSSVVSLAVGPYVPEPNVVAVRIVRARAGLLPLPLGAVLDRLSQAAGDLRLQLRWRHSGGDPVAMFSVPGDDGERIVRIETVRLGDGEIFIAGTTQRRAP